MIKMKREALILLSCLLIMGFLQAYVKPVNAVVGVDSITPETLEATLRPGESVTETKSVVMLAFGLPGVYWVGNITLKVCNESYKDWLVSVNPEWITAKEPTDNVYVFDIEIKVPDGTPPGTYSFQIAVYPYPDGSQPWSGSTQQVTITVPPSLVIPIAPAGTIILGIVMIVALAMYIKLPRKSKASFQQTKHMCAK